MDKNDVRKLLEKSVKHIEKNHKNMGKAPKKSTGHEGGNYIEDFITKQLKKQGHQIKTTPEVLQEITKKAAAKLQQAGQKITADKLYEQCKQHPFFNLNRRPGKQLLDYYLNDTPINDSQEDTADRVLHREGQYHILNIKSHDGDKTASRAPNIVSAKKILDYYRKARKHGGHYYQKIKNDFEIYFIAVEWQKKATQANLNHITIKQLTALDLVKAPNNLVNFNAAIQIQWKITEMQETTQTTEQFMHALYQAYQTSFDNYLKNKQRDLEAYAKCFEHEPKAQPPTLADFA